MANRFWVGGTGTWDASSTANWSTTTGGASGASAPTSGDVALFDANSGAGTCTTAAGAVCSNLTMNSAVCDLVLGDDLTANGTLTLTSGSINLASHNLTCNIFVSSNSNIRTLDFGTGKITLVGNAATIWSTNTITNFTILGSRVVDCTFAGSAGTRTFFPATAHTEANAINFNITAGTDTVDFTTSARRPGSVDFTGFSGTLTNFVVVMFGDLTFSPTMTLTSATGVTQFAGNGTQTITSNGQTIPFTLSIATAGNLGTRVFADALTLGAGRALVMRASIVKFAAGSTNTATGFGFFGTVTNQLILQSTVPGTQYTLSQASGTVDATFTTLQDCNATGGATWNAYTTSGNIDAGNNTGWDFFTQLGKYIYTRRKNKRILL